MNNPYFLIAGSILLLGIILFLMMIFRRIKLKNISIKHYEDIRDNLTIKEDINEEESGGGSIVGGIISLTIVIIVFAKVLMPTIHDTNVDTWSASEVSLWNTTGLIAVVGILFVIMSVFGVMDINIKTIKKAKKKKNLNKNLNIKHYEDIRDNLTIKEETNIEDEEL